MIFNRRYLYVILTVLGSLLLVAVGLFYYFFDPAQEVFAPKCPFWLLTGLKCPGCGGQRVIHAWLHGDFLGGLMYNPILVVLLPYFLVLFYLRVLRGDKYFPKLATALDGNIAILIFLIVVVLYTVMRNIFNF